MDRREVIDIYRRCPKSRIGRPLTGVNINGPTVVQKGLNQGEGEFFHGNTSTPRYEETQYLSGDHDIEHLDPGRFVSFRSILSPGRTLALSRRVTSRMNLGFGKLIRLFDQPEVASMP